MLTSFEALGEQFNLIGVNCVNCFKRYLDDLGLAQLDWLDLDKRL